MAFSMAEGKGFFRDWIINFAEPLGHKRFLDIGCGAGHYGQILRQSTGHGIESTPLSPAKVVIDAVEIFPEYIDRHQLRPIYNEIIIGDIRELEIEKNYDLIIMGDIIEHLKKEDAIRVINKLKDKCFFIWGQLPMKANRPWSLGYDQGEHEWEENPFNQHLHEWTMEELIATFNPLWLVPYRRSGVLLIEGVRQ
jgi:SAM-dependent methyltransferase